MSTYSLKHRRELLDGLVLEFRGPVKTDRAGRAAHDVLRGRQWSSKVSLVILDVTHPNALIHILVDPHFLLNVEGFALGHVRTGDDARVLGPVVFVVGGVWL